MTETDQNQASREPTVRRRVKWSRGMTQTKRGKVSVETTIETEGDDSHEPTLAMLDSMVAELEARWPAEEAS
jgi:hypothetical protein